jgi:hypothetical protein
MPRKKTKKVDPLVDLGTRLRNLVLSVRIVDNPYHDKQEWKEVPPPGIDVWIKIAQALVKVGWQPPQGEWKTNSHELRLHAASRSMLEVLQEVVRVCEMASAASAAEALGKLHTAVAEVVRLATTG